MASGFEIAGVVLAVLPLGIEAARAYKDGATTMKHVVLPKYRDELLQEIYEDLWWEMWFFSVTLQAVLEKMSLSDQQKAELTTGMHTEASEVRIAAEPAFRGYFGEDFSGFCTLLDKISTLLARLIEYKYIGIQKSEVPQGELLTKLRTFIKSRADKQTSSSLHERLKLHINKGKLKKWLLDLRKYNKRVERLVKEAQGRAGVVISPVATTHIQGKGIARPASTLCLLPQILHRALSDHWQCRCSDHHRALLCLPPQVHRNLDDHEMDFSLLFEFSKPVSPAPDWQEGRVRVLATESSNPASGRKVIFSNTPSQCSMDKSKLASLCAEVQSHSRDFCLCLLAQKQGSRSELWRVRSDDRKIEILNSVTEKSLDAVLANIQAQSLATRRTLALIIAYGLILFSGSPWLPANEKWTKNQISFFHKAADEIDFARPFISYIIDNSRCANEPLKLDIVHPNPSLLSLGILLIELQTGKPIESFRLPGETINENTDCTVAKRVIKDHLDSCSDEYKEAIAACLKVPWRKYGASVKLEESETRDAVYNTIISRLEAEVEILLGDLKMSLVANGAKMNSFRIAPVVSKRAPWRVSVQSPYGCLRAERAVTRRHQSTHQGIEDLSNDSTRQPSKIKSLPPHSLMPTGMLIRASLVSTISSKPLLLNLALNVLTFLTKTRISLLRVGKNPVIHSILKKTFYNHFCAGENGAEVTKTIQNLKDMGFKGVILTYAKEIVVDANLEEKGKGMIDIESGKATGEEPASPDIESWKSGVMTTVRLLGEDDFLALKLTGAGASVMKSLSTTKSIPNQMTQALHEICNEAVTRNFKILVDAEQQSVQLGIDAVALDLMRKYNTPTIPTVYNTYQAYLKSTPQTLHAHMQTANNESFSIGIKLVRGAYMASEPRHLINDTKSDTDDSYNAIASGLLQQTYTPFTNASTTHEPFPTAALFLATHNKESATMAHSLHASRRAAHQPTIDRVQYGQLLGMADEVSCSMLQMGRQEMLRGGVAPAVYKCLSWGTLEDCLSYLLRRARENKDAVGRSQAEYQAVWAEVRRRMWSSVFG